MVDEFAHLDSGADHPSGVLHHPQAPSGSLKAAAFRELQPNPTILSFRHRDLIPCASLQERPFFLLP